MLKRIHSVAAAFAAGPAGGSGSAPLRSPAERPMAGRGEAESGSTAWPNRQPGREGAASSAPAPAGSVVRPIDFRKPVSPGSDGPGMESPENEARGGEREHSNALATPLHVLIAEDDASVRKACAEIATGLGFYAIPAESGALARAILAAQPIDLLLLDLKLPGGGGLPLLEEVRNRYPNIVVVVMTAFATVSSAVEAMRSGASDYLTKPFGMEQLTVVLERAAGRRTVDLEARVLREQIRAGAAAGLGPLIGRSAPMEKLYRMLSKVALTTHPVLILGESGTGKEVVARMIHSHGPHAKKPFIPVDCGSLVPTLIESELFGHVKGAFTGALRAKEGLLVAAGNGTVFLDEIGELPLDLQAKLLRALQEKEVRPVGATFSMPVGARILAATNQDLTAMVESGRFRKDLYFRLNVVNIQLPPLRERKGDIPLLAAHVLERLCRESGKRVIFSDEALRMLNEYDWPGNVRELEHAIERAVALSSGPVLHRADFSPELQNYRAPRRSSAAGAEQTGDEGAGGHKVVSIAAMEKQAILNTIRQLEGDKLTAARLLGIGKTTLYRKLKEYGIDPGNLPEE